MIKINNIIIYLQKNKLDMNNYIINTIINEENEGKKSIINSSYE